MKRFIKVLKFIFSDQTTFNYFTYTLLVLGTLFALSFAAFYPVQREAKLVVTDTLPGLVYGAEINSFMDDNFVRLLLKTNPQFTNEVGSLMLQIERDTQANERIIEKYQESIYDQEDRKSCEAFIAARRDYIITRKKFIERLRANPAGAAADLKSTILPVFQKYHEAGRELINYNARVGEERSARIQRLAVRAILLTVLAPIFVLFVGLVVAIKMFKL